MAKWFYCTSKKAKLIRNDKPVETVRTFRPDHHIPPSVIWFHDAWWRHQMDTFSVLLAICAGNSPVTSVFPTPKPVTRSFDVFICSWIHGWVNNREAGDLRRHRARYGVSVMYKNTFDYAWLNYRQWRRDRNQDTPCGHIWTSVV